jgi:hypothetical protein
MGKGKETESAEILIGEITRRTSPFHLGVNLLN